MVFESKCACSCGDSYTGNNVAALGHNYVQSGDVYTCSRCGDSYSGHQHTYTETVTEPTCEQDGYTTYTCSCGYSYTDNVVSALGHDYILAGQYDTIAAYSCTRCGHTYTVVVPVNPNPPSEEYGLRRNRVSVTTEYHEYVYASGTLLREIITTTDAEGDVATETLDFVYDLAGSPYALNYTNGTNATETYYYITNIQGDVTHLVTTNGTVVAEYGYDAWGKVTAATGTMAEVNPLRYRGYYYDTETGLYYVSSRYYDPEIGRWVNADDTAYLGADGTLLSYNLFVYCKNNPVMGYDPTGYFGLVGAIIATGAIVGGLLGAFSAATTGGNILESAIEGCLTGALGAACGILISNPIVAVGLATIGGAAIDFTTQVTTQYVETKSVDMSKIDRGRIVKTGLQTGIGTAIPAFGEGAGNAVDAFGTALIWAEASTMIVCTDVVATNAIAAVQSSSRSVPRMRHCVAIHEREMLLR